MVVELLHPLAYLQNALQALPLVETVVLAQIERIPKSKESYHNEPPEQYSVMYHTVSGCSMIS